MLKVNDKIKYVGANGLTYGYGYIKAINDVEPIIVVVLYINYVKPTINTLTDVRIHETNTVKLESKDINNLIIVSDEVFVNGIEENLKIFEQKLKDKISILEYGLAELKKFKEIKVYE